MTLEAVASFVREMEDLLSKATSMKKFSVVALLFKQVKKDNDLSGLLFEKFEANRKLMRYEQQAFINFARRAWLKNNKTKPRLWCAINRFINF